MGEEAAGRTRGARRSRRRRRPRRRRARRPSRSRGASRERRHAEPLAGARRAPARRPARARRGVENARRARGPTSSGRPARSPRSLPRRRGSPARARRRGAAGRSARESVSQAWTAPGTVTERMPAPGHRGEPARAVGLERRGRRRAPAPVQPDEAPLARRPEQREGVAADARRHRLDDAEHGRGGERRVDRVAAPRQHRRRPPPPRRARWRTPCRAARARGSARSGSGESRRARWLVSIGPIVHPAGSRAPRAAPIATLGSGPWTSNTTTDGAGEVPVALSRAPPPPGEGDRARRPLPARRGAVPAGLGPREAGFRRAGRRARRGARRGVRPRGRR